MPGASIAPGETFLTYKMLFSSMLFPVLEWETGHKRGSSKYGKPVWDDVATPPRWQQWGIDAAAHPKLSHRIKAGKITEDEAFNFYVEKYVKKIYGWDTLISTHVGLLNLLVWGRIHGRGQYDYVRALQQFIGLKGNSVDGRLGPQTMRHLVSSGKTDEQVVKHMKKLSLALAIARTRRKGFPRKHLIKAFSNRIQVELKNSVRIMVG